MRVACMGEINLYKMLIIKPEGKMGLDANWWMVLTLMECQDVNWICLVPSSQCSLIT